MNNREQCARYFQKQPGFERCFFLMKKKWEAMGKAAGKIVLTDCSELERAAMERFFGRTFPGDNISFPMADFEKALLETRFAPITLEELLSAYFGKALSTNQEKRQESRRRKLDFFESGRAAFAGREDGAPAAEWIGRMEETKDYGYQLLVRELTKDGEKARELMRCAGECLLRLKNREDESVRLAVLAAQVTGNPHYFDRGQTAGALLIHALRSASCRRAPEGARELSEFLLENGVRVDDISSTVTVYGLHLETQKGLHPGCEGFFSKKEAHVVTLENLSSVRRAFGESDTAFIVENEMVFSHLTENLRGLPALLICTSGQLRTAAFVLIELLIREGTRIFYSGDLDPEGMDIADRLWQKYPDSVTVWRMSGEDYFQCISEETLEDKRLAMLPRLKNPQLIRTAAAVGREKRAGYQEGLLGEMERDIRESCDTGRTQRRGDYL